MLVVKIAVTIDRDLVAKLDELVESNQFPSRSRAVQDAIRTKQKRRLARECAKLNAESEQALADEGLTKDFKQWPPY